ncbi:MAG: HAD family hydrolase [Spirochaetaceae bacterium]
MELDSVAFDVDGTLYPNSLMYIASVPFFLTRPRLVPAFRRVRRRIRAIRPIDDLHDMQARMLADELQTGSEQARGLIERRIYRSSERVLAAVPTFRGVRAALERLRGAGLKLAVLSDFPLGSKLARLGLDGLWDVELSSEDVGYLKPNPEPFEALLERLGTEAARTIFVGNNYYYDVLGARAVGLRTVHFSRVAHPESEADLTVHTYAGLADHILDCR